MDVKQSSLIWAPIASIDTSKSDGQVHEVMLLNITYLS